jgi:PiT family inorganic phosphate transporter
VTVFAVATLGIMRSNLNWHLITHRLLPAWISVPIVAFFITWGMARSLYPLRGWNYRLYEHLSKHEWKLRAIVIASSCYLAVAVGAHLAYVVGPLAVAGVLEMKMGMLLFTPVFGLGGHVFFSTTKTVGKGLVPIGLYSATIVNLVVGTLVLVISWLGLPQSMVHAQTLCVLAIALTKDGSYEVLRHRMIRKIFVFWIVTPLLSSLFAVLLLWAFGR